MKTSYTLPEIGAICDKILEDLEADGLPLVQVNIVSLSFLILRASLPLQHSEGTQASESPSFSLVPRGYTPAFTLPSGIIEIDFEEAEKQLFESLKTSRFKNAPPILPEES